MCVHVCACAHMWSSKDLQSWFFPFIMWVQTQSLNQDLGLDSKCPWGHSASPKPSFCAWDLGITQVLVHAWPARDWLNYLPNAPLLSLLQPRPCPIYTSFPAPRPDLRPVSDTNQGHRDPAPPGLIHSDEPCRCRVGFIHFVLAEQFQIWPFAGGLGEAVHSDILCVNTPLSQAGWLPTVAFIWLHTEGTKNQAFG